MKQRITKTSYVALFVLTFFTVSAFVNAQTPASAVPTEILVSEATPETTPTPAINAAASVGEMASTSSIAEKQEAAKDMGKAANANTGRVVAKEKPKAAVSNASAELIEATKEYKASSTELLALQEKELTKATAKLEDLRALVTDGLIAKATLEAEEQSVAALRARFEATQKEIAESDGRIAKIKADEELARKRSASPVKLVAKAYVPFNTNATILRSSGAGSWSLGGLGDVQSFFASSFGRSLPTSAIGQSGTHNRLNYDHRNAVDVALHPDSAEGRALIGFLQSRGIPFLAFRGAIHGVATGPHIHIGSPSHRLS